MRSSTADPTLADVRPPALVQPAIPRCLPALVALTKPRLAFFSVLSAMAAYGASRAPADPGHALATLLGTTLAAGGALSLNQWWERDLDRRMRRTCRRPLPSAALTPATALAWSLALSAAGVVVLAVCVNVTAAALALGTILLYGLVYTPLKRRTRWATEVGAVAGALPPLIGGAASGDLRQASAAWTLFAVLLVWQMPHFFAIGWMHRGDYRAAGFRLLPALDTDGRRTGAWSLAYAALLVAVAPAACALGAAGALFLIVAGIAGAGLAWRAVQFARAHGDPPRDAAARGLFIASVAYLPVVMAALLLDRIL